MILTVSANPAVDKTAAVSRLIPGQVMRLRDVAVYAGGKGVNVSRVLSQYNAEVTAAGFCGGASGEFIINTLKECGVRTEFIKTSGNTRTNLNILSDDGYVTEILEPGPDILNREEEAFIRSYDRLVEGAEVIVISGSLPEGLCN